MSTLKKGSKVRLVQPVIEGEVLAAETDSEQFGYRVRYKDPHSEDYHERFFPDSALEEIKEKGK